MKVVRDLIERAERAAGDLEVVDYVIGLGLVGVKLSDGSGGVAYNLRGDLKGECEEFFRTTEDGYGPPLLPGMKAREFIENALSPEPLLRSLGIATVNAVLNRGNFSRIGVLEYLNVKEDDVVGMIGKIKPFVFEILPVARELMVFEKARKDEVLPDWAIASELERCTVVIISGSSVVNWTVEWVLDYVRTDRVAIVGPSSPMVDVFPVSIIGGALIKDPDKALKILSIGGGTKALYSWGAAEKVSLVLR